jgi:hypothetical protein
MKPISRRDLLYHGATGLGFALLAPAARSAPNPLHCTPAPEFSVPLTAGVWRSAPFPVGKHDYHAWLEVDRQLPLQQLDCDLGPPRPPEHCDAAPLLDVEWKIWDGDLLVKSWTAKPIQPAAWGATRTSCFLGDFEGKRNGIFTLEWNVKRDAGRLKDLHPRVQIVKNPGYWCWL